MSNQPPALACATDRRRNSVREQRDRWNGLDYLEVSDDQLTLTAYFLNKAPERITEDNVRVDGGQRVTGIRVRAIDVCRQADPRRDDCLRIYVDKIGDYSTYTLCLVDVDDSGRPIYEPDGRGGKRYRPMPGIDPRYACLPFTFKAGCPTDLDCQPQATCLPPSAPEPEISYLAKDYASFRQLILDRLALVMPGWQERHVPDLGIAMAELLAYAGDALSYYQDAVATEAYLRTARQRISVRRHARLVDYVMHEGCNARAWVCVKTDADLSVDADDIFFVTGYNDALRLDKPVLDLNDLLAVPANTYEVFQPVWDDLTAPIELCCDHSTIDFYAWGDDECCLPRGATSATLVDGYVDGTQQTQPADQKPQTARQARARRRQPVAPAAPMRKLSLKPGDVLIFEEVIGPKTGSPDDADPTHRHAVRLTSVEQKVDALCDQPIVEISWGEEDALPFPLCLSVIGPAPECALISKVSVARGNAILVDHGRWVMEKDPEDPHWIVPPAVPRWQCVDEGEAVPLLAAPARFRPVLTKGPLTFRQPLPAGASAAAMVRQDPRQAVPHIELKSVMAAPDSSGPIYSLKTASLIGFGRSVLPPPGSAGTPDGATLLIPPDARKDLETLVDNLRLSSGQGSPLGFLAQLLSARTRQLLGQSDTTDELLASLDADLVRLLSEWRAQSDLLASDADDFDYVAEMDNDGRAHLRFGDGELGRRLEPGTGFVTRYRVGNGQIGNVGAGAIHHAAFHRTLHIDGIGEICNPLPARGGVDPEPLEQVKLLAPFALRADLQRAITPEDFAALVMRDFGDKVQRCRASLRWAGSWYEVLVAVDPLGGTSAAPALLAGIERYLEPYRRMGYDVVARLAHYVSLHVAFQICVRPDFVAGHVKAALLDVLSNRRLRDNTLGFFHPDNLTFGDGILLSKLVATARAVPGVEYVDVTQLHRYGQPPEHELDEGILRLGPLEVARLDNDPGNPENGLLELEIGGGR